MGYEQSAGKLSQLTIDADLAMGAHAITINDGGLIDGKDVSTLNKISTLDKDADLAMGAHNITLGAGQTVDGQDVGGLSVVVTGAYTGDGAVEKDVDTGLTTLEGVIIFEAATGGATKGIMELKNDTTSRGHVLDDGAITMTGFSKAISGGHFYVDDNNANTFPNQNATNYLYIAWGVK